MVIRELFVKLGLTKDEASFATGMATVEALKAALYAVAQVAQEARRFLSDQVAKTVEAGVAADRFAQKMGLSVKEVQQFAYVGRTAGVTLDDMQAAMRGLAMKGVTDLKGTLFSLADQFKKMPDGGYKLGLATEYLGRAGGRLIPVLNKGRDAIKDLMQEAVDLGYVMDKSAIAKTKEYEESTVRLGASLEGLRNSAVIRLLPYLEKGVTWMTKAVLVTARWIKDAQGLQVHLIAIAGAIAAVFLPEIIALGTAAITAAAPFVLWALAIAAVYLALDDLITFLTNGDSLIGRALHKWLGPFTTWQEALGKVWDKVKEDFGKAMDWVLTEAPKAAAKIGAAMEANFKANSPVIGGLLTLLENLNGSTQGGLGDRFTSWLAHDKGGLGGALAGGAYMPGGASSPDTAAGYSSASGGTAFVPITQHITVNAPNADASEVAKEVHSQSQEHAKRARRTAAQAAMP